MTDNIALRASAMPLAFACPGSVRHTGLRVEPRNEAAALGSAAHEALRPLSETGFIDWGALPEIAGRHGVSVDELRMLCARATKLWPALADTFDGAWTEVPLSWHGNVSFSGHLDLLVTGARIARGADWKSGRKDSDYAEQMRAYCVLLLLDDKTLDSASMTIVWLRDGDAETYSMSRADADKWLARVQSEIVEWDGVFHPGDHCTYCPRAHECEAAHALARRDVAAMSADTASAELAMMKPGEALELARVAKRVAGYAARVREAIKAHVSEHGDIVADGMRLTIDEQTNRELEPLEAWPVLQEAGFGPEELAGCIKLSVGKVEKTAARKAGRGKGAKAVRELQDKLQEAGAIGLRNVRKLTEKREA